MPDGTDAVILELGANDMLRGIDPEVTRAALDAILRRLTERHIAVLLCGMRAAPNLGADYDQAFERIYPELAAKYGALLYPFFLDGVAGNPGSCSPMACIPTRPGSPRSSTAFCRKSRTSSPGFAASSRRSRRNDWRS